MRIFIVTLCFILVFALAGCSKTESTPSSSDDLVNAVTTTEANGQTKETESDPTVSNKDTQPAGGTTVTKGDSAPSTGKQENGNTTKANATTARGGATSTTAKAATTAKTKATTTVNWQENNDWSDFM